MVFLPFEESAYATFAIYSSGKVISLNPNLLNV